MSDFTLQCPQNVSVSWHVQVRLDVRKVGAKRARKLGIAMDGQLLPPDKVSPGCFAFRCLRTRHCRCQPDCWFNRTTFQHSEAHVVSTSALQAVRGGKFKGSRRMQRKGEATAAGEGPPAAGKRRVGKKQQKQKQKHAQKQQQRGQNSQKGASRRQGRLGQQGGGVHKGGARRT